MFWEYLGSFSTQSGVSRSEALPTDSSDYTPSEFYDLSPPAKSARFRAEGMTRAEYLALDAAVSARNSVVSVTDSTGAIWSGRLQSLSGDTISGTDHMGSIELSILLQ